MSQRTLFSDEEARSVASPEKREAVGAVRLLKADRSQTRMRVESLEELLAPDHKARLFWAATEKLDLSQFYEPIRAREGEPGRSPADPRILLTLWLYANSENVGSARELDRLCEAHDAYRWICGGVPMNYHSLSDFRGDHGEAIDELMAQVLALMMYHGLVKLARVAQDGTRIRASAGAGSFRRQKRLEDRLKQAREHVQALKAAGERSDGARDARRRAAAERAAREKQVLLERALQQLPLVQAKKRTADEKAEARVSTTDPEARVMKMGDGGFRPAYNVQLATDTGSRAIVGVRVTNEGSDAAQLEPMLKAVQERTGEKPKEVLIDGGYVNLKAMERVGEGGVTLYAPVPEPRKEGVDRYAPKDDDGPQVAAWRQRMATEPAKDIYKQRGATAETVNADLKTHRALGHLPVRGLAKVLTVVLWAALTYNLLRCFAAGLI